MKKLGNRVKVSTSTTSTGTITFGSAVTAAFLTPSEAGLADNDIIAYLLVDGSNVEGGYGTIGGSVTTMTRDTVRFSKISGTAGTSKINLSGSATLFIAPSAEDFKFQETHGSDIASASTIDLESSTGELVDVTGTTTITAVTLLDGHARTVRFTGALTLTHGSNLVLPGAANITTASGDFAIFRGYSAGVVRCVLYRPATGKSVIPPAFSEITSKPTTLSGYGITDSLPASYLDTDGTLAANSDTKVASQKAVKTYADALIAAADAMVFKGVIDCSANPNYPAADRGATYRVSVAGKIGGASGNNVEAGDLLICLTDSTASGTQAGVGASWTIAQANLDGAVIGPASATDGAIALYDGTTGKLLKNGVVPASFNAGTATALATARAIDGQNFDGTAAITVIAPGTHAATSKTTPVDADELPLVDSAASNVLKKLTWANLKATLKTYLDTLYQTILTVAGASDIRTGTDNAKLITALAIANAHAFVALTDQATITWDGKSDGFNTKVTLGGNRTIGAPTNLLDGRTYQMKLTQDGTGSRTGTFNAIFDFGSVGAPTLSTGAGKTDLVTGTYCSDDSKLKCSFWKSA